MKKTILLPLLLMLLSACENTEYSSFLETMSMDHVTKVSLNPNSPVLIADGVSELKFLAKTYMNVKNERTVEVIVNGENEVQEREFETETLVKTDRLSVEDLSIVSSRGEIVESFIYSTDAGAGTVIEFTCTIGGMTSTPCAVRLIEKPAHYTKEIVVPIVFHLLSTTDTQVTCNAITESKLTRFVDRANNVFAANQYATAPATIDSKIRFTLATRDPEGNPMKEAGIDRHDFGDNFSDYYANIEDYLWDPDKYLNVYVYQSYMSYTVGPQSILSSAAPFPGFPDIKAVDSPSSAYYGSWDSDWGIVVDVDEFMKLVQPGNSNRFEGLLGAYYGLLSTMYVSSLYDQGDVDYCSDTYTYRSIDMSIEKMTFVPKDDDTPPIYYDSFNIMDGSSIASAITPEQVARMRFVIENCPGRMAGW